MRLSVNSTLDCYVVIVGWSSDSSSGATTTATRRFETASCSSCHTRQAYSSVINVIEPTANQPHLSYRTAKTCHAAHHHRHTTTRRSTTTTTTTTATSAGGRGRIATWRIGFRVELRRQSHAFGRRTSSYTSSLLALLLR
jgi:hypothetical protein